MHSDEVDQDLLQRRLAEISAGLKEAVRREVRRLRQLGMPIYVARGGKIISLQSGKSSSEKKAHALEHGPSLPDLRKNGPDIAPHCGEYQ